MLIEFIWLLYLEGKSDFSQTVQRIYPFDLNDCSILGQRLFM